MLEWSNIQNKFCTPNDNENQFTNNLKPNQSAWVKNNKKQSILKYQKTQQAIQYENILNFDCQRRNILIVKASFTDELALTIT